MGDDEGGKHSSRSSFQTYDVVSPVGKLIVSEYILLSSCWPAGGEESHGCERKRESETAPAKNGKNGSYNALLSYSLFEQINVVVKFV
jgi:hypothetical protein